MTTAVVFDYGFGNVRSMVRALANLGVDTTLTSDYRQHGAHAAGIGLIGGSVNLLDADVVPHMGWDTIEAAPDSVLLNGVENERFYFVHSYAAMEVKPADTSRFDIDLSDSPERVSWCSYGRSRFVAAYEHGPLSATQFHPEKSGDAGSQLLKNWIATL